MSDGCLVLDRVYTHTHKGESIQIQQISERMAVVYQHQFHSDFTSTNNYTRAHIHTTDHLDRPTDISPTDLPPYHVDIILPTNQPPLERDPRFRRFSSG